MVNTAPPSPGRALRTALRRGASVAGVGLERQLPRVAGRLTRGLTVFVFHEITDSPSEFQRTSRGFTTPEALAGQLRWISSRFSVVAPTALPRLGGHDPLPGNAALLSFDDAWAGVFRVGLPILESLGLPALCFVNMATVMGAPDFAAVRRFERMTSPTHTSRLDEPLSLPKARRVVAEIEQIYGSDATFRAFQGSTATPQDLEQSGRSGDLFWLGSHLFHHWDATNVSADVVDTSALSNRQALQRYPNVLPALATPYGRPLSWPSERASKLGVRTLFVVSGGQNTAADSPVLDRLALEPEPSQERDWWWSTHRRRLFGRLAS